LVFIRFDLILLKYHILGSFLHPLLSHMILTCCFLVINCLLFFIDQFVWLLFSKYKYCYFDLIELRRCHSNLLNINLIILISIFNYSYAGTDFIGSLISSTIPTEMFCAHWSYYNGCRALSVRALHWIISQRFLAVSSGIVVWNLITFLFYWLFSC